jgi:hypothetical protein
VVPSLKVQLLSYTNFQQLGGPLYLLLTGKSRVAVRIGCRLLQVYLPKLARCCYITVDFVTAESQESVCMTQEMCYMYNDLVSKRFTVKDESNKKNNFFVLL